MKMDSNYSAEELLKYITENGMIDLSNVQKEIEMDKRNKILEQHKSPIWSGTNGRWYTYLPDDTKKNGRKQIAKSSKDKIDDAVVEFYLKINEDQTMTFKKMFLHWVEIQQAEVSQNTVTKYWNDYRRCVAGTDFENLPINTIKTETIRAFLGKRVKAVGLPQRAYTNLIGYFKGVFNSALENEHITKNPMDTYVINRQFRNCKKSEKTKTDKTVSKDELPKIFEAIDEELQKNPWRMSLYAILLAAFTGMRVGELSALAWKDVYDKEGYISVCQAEVRIVNRGSACEFIISGTKTDTERDIPVTNEIRSLFGYIRKLQKEMGIDAEYVFENLEGRAHKTAIASCAAAVSKKAGVKSKSIHCYRKTLSSMLHSLKSLSGLEVSSILGHGVEVNAKHYSFDLGEMQPKQDALSKANKSVVDFADYQGKNSVIKSVIKSGVV